MIGVVAPESQHETVREFFELFKTPWEFARQNRLYEVAVCTEKKASHISAKVTLNYRSLTEIEKCPADDASWIQSPRGGLPVYCGLQAMDGTAYCDVVTERDQMACVVVRKLEEGTLVQIGFNLFAEIEYLLTRGQPSANASVPTLDRHIALLRHMILRAGVPLVEVPPTPGESPFAVCLTHDVDHPVMRNHFVDSTMLGFVYRATLGSLVQVWRGRATVSQLWRNWFAVLKLPLIYLGISKDTWRESLCAYGAIEEGMGSTFFVIPFRERPGQRKNGEVSALRGARYGVGDVRKELQSLQKNGCEVGLHGIDAWSDPAAARIEMKEISTHVDNASLGVRMHWLFFDSDSYRVLESAGFSYDSTVGYNETVGYKAGTAQVFKPLCTKRLMELPLHIMDTSLFYPAHLNLSNNEARDRVDELIDNAENLGGVITINWHDRSVAPERLWGGFYGELLENLKQRGAWFPTGSQVVEWYRQRRSAHIEEMGCDEKNIRVRVTMDEDPDLPGLRLRIHKPHDSDSDHSESYEDVPLHNGEHAFSI